MGIEPDAVASYVDRAVEAMADIVGDLGDDLRDRAAEFRASGPTADLIAAAQEAQRRFRADIVTADPKARPRGGAATRPDELEFVSQGHALLHVMEEVCQHLGQMEITRDLLRQS